MKKIAALHGTQFHAEPATVQWRSDVFFASPLLCVRCVKFSNHGDRENREVHGEDEFRICHFTFVVLASRVNDASSQEVRHCGEAIC